MKLSLPLMVLALAVCCTPMKDLDEYSQGSGGSGGFGGEGPTGGEGGLPQAEPVCGNGEVEFAEECDDGGMSSDCRDDCTLLVCPEACECQAFDGSYLVMCPEPIRFAGARQNCSNAGFGFDIPLVAREQEFIQAWQSRLGINMLWLGGSDAAEEGTWRTGTGVTYWNGGILGEPVAGVYVNWRPSQPDNLDDMQHCMSQMVAGGWDDEGCGLNHAYICSVRPRVRAACGDGTLDPDEICDDAVATSACDSDCSAPFCGDGLVNEAAGEECDDQNDEELDACDSDCKSTGLLAHYPLNERLGTIAWDAASHRHHGVLLGELAFPSDGSGVMFDGLTQYIDVPAARAPRVEGPATLIAVVEATLPLPTDSTHQDIVTQRDANEETWLRIVGSNVQAGSWLAPELYHAELPLTDLWQTASWHHLAARYDGTSWAVFHDGVLMAEQASPNGALPATGSLSIGGRSDGRFFSGRVKNVRYYDRSLPASYILELATRSLAGELP